MRKEFRKGNVGKGNDGGGVSGLPRHTATFWARNEEEMRGRWNNVSLGYSRRACDASLRVLGDFKGLHS